MNQKSKFIISKTIPIVYATDDSFVLPARVAIWSMLKNSSQDFFYDIYIMHTDELSQSNMEFLTQISEVYSNCSINFLGIDKEQFEGINLIPGITVSSMFRLLICDYLQEYEKCLYIDSDVVVLEDISELYTIPLGENYIAGIRDNGVQHDFEKLGNYAKTIGIDSMHGYVNSGVLVMNLSAIRSDGLKEKFLSQIKEKYEYLDQDILNKCCRGRIKQLPLKYNLFRKFYQRVFKLQGTDFSDEEIKEAQEAPVILHYAERLKPWVNIRGVASDVWWAYAQKALSAKVYNISKERAQKRAEADEWEDVISFISCQKDVVIFGFSFYGKTILKILHGAGLRNIVAFCDNNPEKQGEIFENINVKSLSEIKEEFTAPFFINTSQKQKDAVLALLLENGYKEQNIWHYDYSDKRADWKNATYYETLDNKYYLSELRNIVLKECGILLDDWDSLCNIVKNDENKHLIEKYNMNAWALK